MPLFPKINGSHKEMTDCKVKVGGEWKQAVEMLVKVNGKWKEVWSNTAIYIVCDTSYDTFEFYYESIDEIFRVENLVVAVYNGNNRLIATANLGTLQTTSGSYAVYDDNDSYGDIGINTDVANNKLIFSVSIDYETDARKFVITADKVKFL